MSNEEGSDGTMSTDKQSGQVEALAKAELWLSFATDDYESRVNSKVIAGELARLRALLTAQPGPVACEPLSDGEVNALVDEWSSGHHHPVLLVHRAARAQRAKCKPHEAHPAHGFGPYDGGGLRSCEPAPTAPAKTATPALDAYLDSWSSNVRSGFVAKCKGLAASDTAGLCAELEAAKAELAEAKRQRDEKLSNDSGEWLREYQAACARERGLVAENGKLAKALAEEKRYAMEKCEETVRMQVEAQRWRILAEAKKAAQPATKEQG